MTLLGYRHAGIVVLVVAAAAGTTASDAVRAQTASPQEVRGLDSVLDEALGTSPEMTRIRLRYSEAQAQAQAAQGAFDPTLYASGEVMPIGEDTRTGVEVGLSQRIGLLWGAAVKAGYANRRAPRVYEGKMTTSEWGEFYGEVNVPLLKDGFADKARTSAEVADLGVAQASAVQLKSTLDFIRGAADQYLDWKESQFEHEVAAWLQRLAVRRAGLVERQIESGQRAPVELWDNGRLVAEREANVQKALANLEVAALNVGATVATTDDGAAAYMDATPRPLFVHERLNRDADEDTDEATPDFLEQDHAWHSICAAPFDFDRTFAPRLAEHPIVLAAAQKVKAAKAKQRLAGNQLLPKLDMKGFVRQDVGPARVYGGDYKTKNATEAGVGLSFQFPTLSRGARGEWRAQSVGVQMAENEMRAARIALSAKVRAQARKLSRSCEATRAQSEAASLAVRVEAAAATEYRLGGTNLLALNLREQQAAGALLKLGAAIVQTERAYMQLYWLVGPTDVSLNADSLLARL